MANTGYPDYQRKVDSGSSLLFNGSGALAEFTVLFSGNVALYPYLILVLNCANSTDFIRVFIDWATDSTFNTIVGRQQLTRQGNNFSVTQYANLSQWMRIYYSSKSGAAFTFNQFTLFACQGRAGQLEISQNDTPSFNFEQSINASSTFTFNPIKVQPGPRKYLQQTAGVSWFTNFYYYDFNIGAYTLYYQINSATYGGDVNIDLPGIEAPDQIQVHNSDTTAKTFLVALDAI